MNQHLKIIKSYHQEGAETVNKDKENLREPLDEREFFKYVYLAGCADNLDHLPDWEKAYQDFLNKGRKVIVITGS